MDACLHKCGCYGAMFRVYGAKLMLGISIRVFHSNPYVSTLLIALSSASVILRSPLNTSRLEHKSLNFVQVAAAAV